MIGILLVTHSNQGEVLLQNAENIVGRQSHIDVVTQRPGSSFQVLQHKAALAIQALNQGQGVLMLVDIYGGTPCNVALSFQQELPIAVVTGLNLAMLLKVMETDREAVSLANLARIAAESGQKSIRVHLDRSEAPPSDASPKGDIEGDYRKASATVTVLNALGLHASNSAKLVKTASRFQAEITLVKGDLEVNTKSIMGVLMLGAAQGTELQVRAAGNDAREAVQAIVTMFKERFDEE